MKVRLTINGRVATATLDDAPAARDFASLLPLNVTLSDYASTEKVSDLPRKLTQEGAPAGYKPSRATLPPMRRGETWRSSIATSAIRAA